MMSVFFTESAFEVHDALRAGNAVLAMLCLGLLTGMWTLIRSMVAPVKQLWAGAWLMLAGLIIGSWEAVQMNTPPTVRTPIFTVALIVSILGIVRLTRHPRPLQPYRKPPHDGGFSLPERGEHDCD